MTLQALGEKHGTDKAAHGYLPIYDRYLEGRDIRSVLEIGVYEGKSLRMWQERFPEARIYGLDVDPGCSRWGRDGIEVFSGSQDDPEVIADLIEAAGGFDLVIDDGSHVNALTLAAFDLLWPATRQLYIIEDLGCSYVNLTPHVSGWPGMKFNRKGLDYFNRRRDMDRFFSGWIHKVDSDSRKHGLTALHFHRHLAVFEK